MFLIIAIQHYSCICIQLNGSEYYDEIQTIQFLHTVEWFQVFLYNSNNAI